MIIKIGTEFMLYSNSWNDLKKQGYFPERDHFPNFNFMFQAICKQLQDSKGRVPIANYSFLPCKTSAIFWCPSFTQVLLLVQMS
jgi:hypothetical protein